MVHYSFIIIIGFRWTPTDTRPVDARRHGGSGERQRTPGFAGAGLFLNFHVKPLCSPFETNRRIIIFFVACCQFTKYFVGLFICSCQTIQVMCVESIRIGMFQTLSDSYFGISFYQAMLVDFSILG